MDGTGIILCQRPASDNITMYLPSSLIGWALSQNDPDCMGLILDHVIPCSNNRHMGFLVIRDKEFMKHILTIVELILFPENCIFCHFWKERWHRQLQQLHITNYSGVIWAPRHLNLPASQLFVQLLVLADNKGNTKALHHWPFVKGINHWPVDSSHKGPVMRKVFPFHDVIMENRNPFILHCQ